MRNGIGDDVYDEEVDCWDDYEEAGDWYYIVSRYKPGIAVRSEPTKDSELLSRIPYGTWFYVEALCDNWGYTTVNGVTGWIDTDYAEVDWDDDGDSVVFEDKGLYKDGSKSVRIPILFQTVTGPIYREKICLI